jgi:hypothetical protein
MTNFKCGVSPTPLVLRLHRIKSGRLAFNITEIWQLRRREKTKVEIAESV